MTMLTNSTQAWAKLIDLYSGLARGIEVLFVCLFVCSFVCL